MNDKVLDFAEEQHKILLDTFLNQGFDFFNFPAVTMYITLNSVISKNLLKNGILAPTKKQHLDASINACDDIIRFFQGYKEKLMNEEG